MARTRKTPLEEVLDKIAETPGFKVTKIRGRERTYRISAPRKGSWEVTLGTPSANNERAWRTQLSRMGWSHALWEQALASEDEEPPTPVAGTRGDEPVDERGFPLVTTPMEDQYTLAHALIAACEMRWELMVIGPEEAQYLLDCHTEAAEARGKEAGLTDTPLPLDAPNAIVQQRKLKEHNVDKIERMMRTGKWKISPQGLAIGIDGWLGDGQHRVEAIQRSSTVQVFWVCHNVPDEVFPYLDRGSPRSDVDLMQMRGKSTDPTLPALLKILWLYDNVPHISEWRNKGRAPLGDELMQYAAKHYPDVEVHLKAVGIFSGQQALTKASAGAMRYVILRDNPAAPVDEFLKQVRKPRGNDASDAADVLHEHGNSRRYGTSPIKDMHVSHWLFLAGLWAWRRHVEGAALKRMGWQPRFGITELPTIH